MLQQICEHIHNYFIKTPYCGNFEIANGTISPSAGFFKDGQRIWITGSDLNDGVYTYHPNGITNDDDTEAASLKDETFAGTICALSIPRDLDATAAEIKAWIAKNGEVLSSPLASESFNGYSYSMKTGSTGGAAYGWQDHFKTQLNRWRRICV